MGFKAENYRLLAGSGTYYVTGSDAISDVAHYGFVATENTIIDEWTVTDANGNERDLVDYFNISGVTITIDFVAHIIPENFRNSETHSFKLTNTGAGQLLRS